MAPGPDNLQTPGDVLSTPDAGARVVRGSAWRLLASGLGILLGLGTAALLLRHLGVRESGRYVTVISLVAVAVAVADGGLNISSTRELTLRAPADRRSLTANIVGQRLVVMPLAVLLVVAFALIAGYPSRMVIGTVLAGAGALLASVANALLVPLTVELRNLGLALVDFARQLVTLVGVAVLVAAGARLTPFFAVLIAAGLAMLALVVPVAGRGALVRPRFDPSEQRQLLATALPLAIALGLGQVYFRLVIVLMSLIASPRQTGYFGGSLRAVESLVTIPALIVGVALPVLTTAARDDHPRLRHAIERLGQGAIIGGTLLILVSARAATPVMSVVGGGAFRPAGAVLRIQVGALLFITLYQIWTGALLALGRQRELILTNVLALAGLAAFAAGLVPAIGARGGATASVMGDALLAGLIYWRLQRRIGHTMVKPAFLARVLVAAGLACAPLVITGLPDLAAAGLSAVVFLVVGRVIGMVPPEVLAAFSDYRSSARAARM
jgi:O-antigen/teichoic acid export membrane protein